MKRLLCLMGIIIPGLATRALAQQMRVPKIDPKIYQNLPSPETHLTLEIKQKLELYAISNDYEKSAFLESIYLNGSQRRLTTLERISIKKNIEEILKKPVDEQNEVILDLIKKGGIEWGKVIDPTARC